MKKSLLVFVVLVFLSLNNNVNAQAFQKGSINIDLGFGVGGYGTKSTYTTNVNGTKFVTTETDGTASTIIPIGFEYGISDRFGLGADLTFNNYLINDSDKVNLDRVNSIDFGLKFNFHLLKAEKNDLYIEFGLGGSKMNWKYKGSVTSVIESASGSGTYFSLGITDRIFFSDHIGVFFNLGYRGYNYSKIKANLAPETEAFLVSLGITDYEQSWKWEMKGVHIGTGLAIKF